MEVVPEFVLTEHDVVLGEVVADIVGGDLLLAAGEAGLDRFYTSKSMRGENF